MSGECFDWCDVLYWLSEVYMMKSDFWGQYQHNPKHSKMHKKKNCSSTNTTKENLKMCATPKYDFLLNFLFSISKNIIKNVK